MKIKQGKVLARVPPSAIVRAVVDLLDILAPADGTADVCEEGHSQLVPSQQPVCCALGLNKTV